MRVKLRPGADKNKVGKFEDGYLKVSVKAKPEKGKANRALIKLLRKHFKKRAEIISGHKSRRKTVRLHELP